MGYSGETGQSLIQTNHYFVKMAFGRTSYEWCFDLTPFECKIQLIR
jgi:hypothetical protein